MTPDRTGERGMLPYTVLSVSMSMDGFISGATDARLVLSNDADLDRVDAVRASCDAILVGARTIRSDDPRLLVRSSKRRADRIAAGLSPTPLKVTVTGGADLDRDARFFTTGGDKLVYCPTGAVADLAARLAGAATVVDGGRTLSMRAVSADLRRRGVRRLMVEGGGMVHTQFLAEDIADELHLVIAPLLIGDERARRFVGEARFPWHPPQRGRLVATSQIGDVALLTYALSERCEGAAPSWDGR